MAVVLERNNKTKSKINITSVDLSIKDKLCVGIKEMNEGKMIDGSEFIDGMLEKYGI